MENFIYFIILVTLGYVIGTWAEKRHYRSIVQREKSLLSLPAVTLKDVSLDEADVEKAELVSGSVVISIDYFKRILAALRKIFGGTVRPYESLIDRARREAMLRMKENAQAASVIVNVRIETSGISKSTSRRSVGCLEAIAYGTALTMKEKKDEIHTPVT